MQQNFRLRQHRNGIAQLCANYGTSAPAPDMAAAELAHGIAAGKRHRAFHFGAQQHERTLNAGLAAGGQRKQVSAADTAGMRAQCQRLDDVVTAADSAVADYFQAITQRVRHRGDTVNRRRRRFQLPAAVIRQHDGGSARLGRLAAILDGLHPFDDERTRPAPREPLDVFPRQ